VNTPTTSDRSATAHAHWNLRIGRAWYLVRWPVLAFSGGLALLLGVAGFHELLEPNHPQLGLADYVYLSLQLFVFEFGLDPQPLPPTLQFARFLAPATSAYAAFRALAVLFDEQVEEVRLRFTRDHVVVAGLGKHGLRLVQDFHEAGDRVVVIERDEGKDDLAYCARHGIRVVVGDARRRGVLAIAGVARASRLVFAAGNDDVNLRIVVAAYDLLKEGDGGHTLPCHVGITDHRLCNLFRRHPVFTDRRDRLEVSVFNTYENAARVLLESHPLEIDRASDLEGHERAITAAADPRQVHLVLLGFGQMGQSVALQAARVLHLANGRHARMTVLDRELDPLWRGFVARYPAFGEVCEVEPLAGSLDHADTILRLREIAADRGVIAHFLICFDGDSSALLGALELVEEIPDIHNPVLVRMAHGQGIASLLQADTSSNGHETQLRPFGMFSRSCTRTILLDRTQDLQARSCHEDYRAMNPGQGFPPWDELDESSRDSNRQQADHMAVKLRALGYEIVTPDAPGASAPATLDFDDAQLTLLARMEHDRWCAERRLEGWVHGEVKDGDKRTNPCLVDFDDLPAVEQAKDRDAVRRIPHLLGLAGMHIRPIATRP
jgi:voltage-gated potassium channel Kch